MLYIVSTPIGNLKDITFRAIEVLKSVDLIAAEDTRHTKILLNNYAIEKPLTSFFEHNQNKKVGDLIRLLQEGKNIALVSDAGTPGISDPGYVLIKAAADAQIPMTVIPGPSAAISALSLSALPTHEFVFVGFLPVKSGGRKKKLEEILNLKKTTIIYESPHRIMKTLQDMLDVMGDPYLVVCRELTKTFEETRRAKASEHILHFSQHPPKGEFVLII